MIVAALLSVVAFVGGLLVAFTLVRRRQLNQPDSLDLEELFRATVDSLVDGVVVQDEAGQVVRVNAAGIRMLAPYLEGSDAAPDQQAAELRPRMLNAHGKPLTDDERIFRVALDSETPIVGKIVGVPSGGEISWFRCNTRVASPRAGHGRLVITSFTDITTERRLAAELSDQELRFRTAIEQAPIGMALVALDGSFLKVNASLCKMTGRTEAELLATSVFSLLHPDDEPLTEDRLQALVDGDEFSVCERQVSTADGSVRHAAISISAIRSDAGTAPYFIIDLLDVTETRQAADAQAMALVREQDAVATLVALDETRSNFISTISHELRMPLTSLVGYLEMLTDGDAGELGETQRKMVAAASRNGERLGRLIDDLLTLAAAERPDSPDRHDLVDIPLLLADVVETLTPLASRGEIQLSTVVDASSATVVGDRAELDRVLLNLIGNAVKYTQRGGAVVVATTTRGQADLQITITDTGVGIPAVDHDRLFTKFFRSSNAQAGAVKGTGLGLVIAQRLVEAHGGRIDVESVEGEGTTVTVSLPLAQGGTQSGYRVLAHH